MLPRHLLLSDQYSNNHNLFPKSDCPNSDVSIPETPAITSGNYDPSDALLSHLYSFEVDSLCEDEYDPYLTLLSVYLYPKNYILDEVYHDNAIVYHP
jgi:hypothetical protein